MFKKYVLFGFINICLIKYGYCQNTKTEWPYDSQCYAIPSPTPISINTSDTGFLIAPPLLFTNGIYENFRLFNTGNAIEIYLGQANTSSTLTGGPLFNNVYRFYKIRFYWNNVQRRCSTAINGRGTPLEVDIYYYKQAYNSFRNALQYRDGVAIVTTMVAVCSKTNFLFYPVQYLLSQVRQPKSFANALSSVLSAWFQILPNSVQYYTFPGSYTNLETGKQYMCATQIVFVPVYAEISEKQFNVFRALLNNSGQTLENSSPVLYPVGLRPVLRGSGVKQIISLF